MLEQLQVAAALVHMPPTYPTAHYPLPTARFPSPFAHPPLPIADCRLPTAHYSIHYYFQPMQALMAEGPSPVVGRELTLAPTLAPTLVPTLSLILTRRRLHLRSHG